MPQNVGQLAEAAHYNSVAENVNKVFGDKYPTAAVTDSSRKSTHKFGWGAVNIEDALANGTMITADRLATMVNHTNVSIDHINVTDSIIVYAAPVNRQTVSANTPVRAEDLNLIDSKFNNNILVNNNHTTVDPTDASLLLATPLSGGPYTRTVPWQTKLTGEHKWSWSSYNAARYFFNGGGNLQLDMTMSGGCTAGYFNWADMINEMGTLVFNWDTVSQSSAITPGFSAGKGFYDLTENYGDGSDAGNADEGLLFTSSGVTQNTGYGYGYGYGYGASTPGIFVASGSASQRYNGSCYSGPTVYLVPQSGYSAYSARYFKLYGKWANGGKEVHFKLVLDNTSLIQPVDGTLEATNRYLMPGSITSGNSDFDVSPDPTMAITDNFNTGDDS